MQALEKKWIAPGSTTKKFLASVLAYGLSRKLNRKEFEAVNDSYIDLHNATSDTPDVIVYDLKNNFHPTLIVELCDNSTEESTVRTIEILSKAYNIDEAFVYNTEKTKWFRFHSGKISSSSLSNSFATNLSELLDKSLHQYV